MPNHVKNKLIFSCNQTEMRDIYKKYSTYCGNWVRFPDLEKIVPYPDGFLAVDSNNDFGEYSTTKDNLKEILDELQLSKDKERMQNFINGIKNYLNTGFFCWYDWNKSNWGTKWNTYACEKIKDFTHSVAQQCSCSISDKRGCFRKILSKILSSGLQGHLCSIQRRTFSC